MSDLTLLLSHAGSWQGPYRLWLSPTDEARESLSTATITPLLGGRFARLDYTWAYEGHPQEGSLIFGYRAATGVLSALWIDSWHMGDQFMVCTGSIKADGSLTVQGTYGDPPGPDWGWRTEITPLADSGFSLRMFNITPEGEEALAVDVVFAPGS